MSILPTTMSLFPPTMSTSPPDIPDDIWLEIFALLSASRLTVLQRVSNRFRVLVARPLLRKVLWVKYAQTTQSVKHWQEKNSDLFAFPRSATVSVAFQGNLTQMYRSIYLLLPKFQSLHTLKLIGTTFGSNVYATLSLPSLKTLVLIDCEYDDQESDNPSINFQSLALSHLKLHNVAVPEDCATHPIRLITARSLISLDITWSTTVATEYDCHIRGAHGPIGLPPLPVLAPAPNLQFLEVRVPFLTRDVLRGLGHLTVPRMITPVPAGGTLGNHVVPVVRSPRVTLQVQHWYMTQEQVAELDRTRQIQQQHLVDAVQGVWSYTGPLEILGIFIPLGLGAITSLDMISTVGQLGGGDGGGDYEDEDDEDEDGGSGYALRHLCLTPPAPESHFLSRLLWAIDSKVDLVLQNRVKRLKGLVTLEICLPRWDVEILFAVRSLFVNITSIVIRVGEPVGGEELFVTLGGNILPHLPKLHTLRIIHDPESISAAEAGRNARSGFVSNPGTISAAPTYKFARPKREISDDKCDDEMPHRKDQATLVKDYLWGWNRYCPALRKVQLSDGMELEKRWEGGEWEMKDIEKEFGSDRYWTTGWYWA